MKVNKLLHFLDAASREEVSVCARSAGTTPAYLFQLARQYGPGRKPGVLLALGIERATAELSRQNPALPAVTVQDIGVLCGFSATIDEGVTA
jgi:hypothetical protein